MGLLHEELFDYICSAEFSNSDSVKINLDALVGFEFQMYACNCTHVYLLVIIVACFTRMLYDKACSLSTGLNFH